MVHRAQNIAGAALGFMIATGASPVLASKPPPAAHGFQLSHQIGPSFPFGKATGNSRDTLARRYGWMIEPAFIGLGGRFLKYWYVGSYFGFALADKGTDRRVQAACRDNDNDLNNDIGCSVATLRVGLEARFNILPDSRANPWVSYGGGPVLTAQTITDRVIDRREGTRMTGWEYARISAGVTFRPSRVIGVGPYFNATAGQYLRSRTTIDGTAVHEGRIEDRTLHAWVGVGVRVEFFP